MRYPFKIVLLFILFSAFNCSDQPKVHQSTININYKAQTRGSYIHLDVKEDTVVYKTAIEEKTVILDSNQLQNIKEIISKINLSKISTLKAPSEKRFTDVAMIASISIQESDNNYYSVDFDHGNPPLELRKLVEKIFSFIQ